MLGEENLIAVGNVAGTEAQFAPPEKVVEAPAAEEGSATATSAAAEGGVTPPAKIAIEKGATVVISEIQGQPTSLLGVIVKGK